MEAVDNDFTFGQGTKKELATASPAKPTQVQVQVVDLLDMDGPSEPIGNQASPPKAPSQPPKQTNAFDVDLLDLSIPAPAPQAPPRSPEKTGLIAVQSNGNNREEADPFKEITMQGNFAFTTGVQSTLPPRQMNSGFPAAGTADSSAFAMFSFNSAPPHNQPQGPQGALFNSAMQTNQGFPSTGMQMTGSFNAVQPPAPWGNSASPSGAFGAFGTPQLTMTGAIGTPNTPNSMNPSAFNSGNIADMFK